MKKVILPVLAMTLGLVGKEPGPAIVAHEWGTFTSVAMDTGAPARWAPWAGPADLPCFVHRFSQRWKLELSGLVRMETPVIYFYAQQPANLSVNVAFPKGLVTEWYPEASKVKAPVVSNNSNTGPLPVTPEGGGIHWEVDVLPGSNPVLPTGQASHYYAARNTDAAPVRSGKESEKLLFYRGVGNFVVPVEARYSGNERLEIRNTAMDVIPVAFAFENHGGKVGYRVLHQLKGEVSIDPPPLTADVHQLHRELARELVAAGLYEKEASAMIETWRDSWFEEGARVIFVMPRSEVDRVLPLDIKPAVTSVARVFVARVEMLSPATARTITQANTTGDVAALKRFGRFLEPFAAQLKISGSPAIEAAKRALAAEYNVANCVQ
jgi:hypothetical protein